MNTEEIQRYQSSPIFSEAVVHRGIVYLAGQVALDHEGGAIEDKVSEVLRRIDALLTRVNSDRRRLLSAVVLLTDAAHLSVFNQLWAKWLPDGQAPARTTFITSLVSPDFAVEVTVTAAAQLSLLDGG
jgi:enamine deaminase RidA (YjgF/YER057c/UK114 family)